MPNYHAEHSGYILNGAERQNARPMRSRRLGTPPFHAPVSKDSGYTLQGQAERPEEESAE